MRNIILFYAHFPHHHSIWKASSSSLSNMTNLPHLWFLHSLSHPLSKGRALCACVCVRTVFWCIVLVWLFSILLCARHSSFITKTLSHLTSAFVFACYWVEPSFLALPLCFSTRSLAVLPHAWNTRSKVDAWHRKDQLSQRKRVEGWEKGLINYAGHDITAADRFCIL